MLDLVEFGATVRHARERRHWRPIDLAIAMGWSGTAPVYRIEHPGPEPRRPTPDTVNLLAQVLELDQDDRLALMGFAGHLLDTRPMTPQEIAHTLAQARPILDESPVPTELFDYRGTILDINDALGRVVGVRRSEMVVWRAQGVTRLDLVCDPRLGLRDRLTNPRAAIERQMLIFKLENRPRRHEAWYIQVASAHRHLPDFADLWERTDVLIASPVAGNEIQRRLGQPVSFRLPNGASWTFEISERGLHGAYGPGGLAAWQPLDATTRTGLRAITGTGSPGSYSD